MKFVNFLIIFLFSALFWAGYLKPVSENSIRKYDKFNAKAVNDSSIIILSWNIHKEVENAQWVKDLSGILEKYNPDIIALQESSINENLEKIFGHSIGYIFASNIIDKKGNLAGVMTASKARPVDYSFIITDNVEPIFKTPKVTLFTSYKLTPSRKSLLTVNVHGINFVSTEKFKSQILKIEDRIKKHKGPVLLSGDFNTWKKKRIDILNKMAGRLNFKKVNFSPSDSTEIKNFLKNPLDHIFYSQDLILQKNSPDVIENITSSDHKPLVAAFKLKKTP